VDNGTFLLTFRENTTVPISYNASAKELEYHLEQLYTIGNVTVTFVGGQHGRQGNLSVCNVWDNVTVYIEFETEFGDLPLLQADKAAILINITEYRKGDKEDMECSGQGSCDESTGICDCYEGFGSSNGTTDSQGERGDCSFYNPFYTQKYLKQRK
jgi:hypothetical protein